MSNALPEILHGLWRKQNLHKIISTHLLTVLTTCDNVIS